MNTVYVRKTSVFCSKYKNNLTINKYFCNIYNNNNNNDNFIHSRKGI